MNQDERLVSQMQRLIDEWRADGEPQALFLDCYRMMTLNVLEAVRRADFADPEWVHALMHHFAGYYFSALESFDQDPETAPAAWQLAFTAARTSGPSALQNLLLGVNAHINYDLVLALKDMLQDDWTPLDEARRARRYADHCKINEIIAGTVDQVQDQILEPAMPVMEWVDRLLGSLDERFIAALISRWRESVWEHTIALLEAREISDRSALIRRVEQHAIEVAELIWPSAALLGLTGHHLPGQSVPGQNDGGNQESLDLDGL